MKISDRSVNGLVVIKSFDRLCVCSYELERNLNICIPFVSGMVMMVLDTKYS
jgi:hypothetical protein